MKKTHIGFIGQGFIGKNYADDFEQRGFPVVRYALEEEYRGNGNQLGDCDIIFVAVPTPTTPDGFDDSIVRSVLVQIGKGKIVVIKSTILPGTTKLLQELYPNIIILYSPEFLSEATAAHDAAHPFSNIVGMPKEDDAHAQAAAAVHEVLPQAPFTLTCDSTEAELIKYAHNISGYVQIVTFNMVYDLARSHGKEWSVIQKALEADPLISNRYAKPVHKSGRGAGGHCFIKDFAAFRSMYEARCRADQEGIGALRAFEKKNKALLESSNKDLDLLKGVYGNGPKMK